MLEQGTFPCPDVPAGEQAPLDLSGFIPRPGECYLNLSLCLREPAFYAPAGYEIYHRQIALSSELYVPGFSNEVCREISVEKVGKLQFTDSPELLSVRSGGIQLTYEKHSGRFTVIRYHGEDIILDMAEQFYRAPTGIDNAQGEQDGKSNYGTIWTKHGLHTPQKQVLSVETFLTDSLIIIHEKAAFCRGTILNDTTYQIREHGLEITTATTNQTGLETLPRIGYALKLPKGFDTVEWYGLGPCETYTDRKSAAMMGKYRSSPAEMHIPFIVPCECGGHEDVRYVTLTDGNHSLKVTGGADFHFSALPYSVEQYTAAAYQQELAPSDGTYLNLDALHAGLGGDTGWSKTIHPEHRIPNGRYFYSFQLEFE